VIKVCVTEWLILFPSPFIDQLKGKINLNVDDMDKLTVDDLRSQVDYAISQVNLQGKCAIE
jgi:ABC-type proline/glycine betaine transport system ATPase subunit